MEIHSARRLKTPVHPGIGILRRAIRGNIVSFPSQIPSLLKEPAADVQWRMVGLFFVCGWRSAKIAARFHVPADRMRKDLYAWSVRAMALGYIQVIEPDAFAKCCHEDVEYESDDDPREALPGQSRSAPAGAPQAVTRAIPTLGERVSPGRQESEDRSFVSTEQGARPMVTLDRAIERCEALCEEFRVLAATLLRELRTVEGMARELRRSREQADIFAAGFRTGESPGGPSLSVSREERVSHAVA
ncbi:MAG: hypothetical protein ABSH56_10070 [Bryobacteraceae bacterium]